MSSAWATGHGVLICGSFVTAGDARMLLKESVHPDLTKPKAERVHQVAVDPEYRQKAQEADAAEIDYETVANPVSTSMTCLV